MEPPLIAAENVFAAEEHRRIKIRFNGAAAHRGGELRVAYALGLADASLQWSRRSSRRRTRLTPAQTLRKFSASMEPPLIAAENEASSDVAPRSSVRFNGAAAHRGGERDDARTADSLQGASMEPPLIAAENFTK